MDFICLNDVRWISGNARCLSLCLNMRAEYRKNLWLLDLGSNQEATD